MVERKVFLPHLTNFFWSRVLPTAADADIRQRGQRYISASEKQMRPRTQNTQILTYMYCVGIFSYAPLAMELNQLCFLEIFAIQVKNCKQAVFCGKAKSHATKANFPKKQTFENKLSSIPMKKFKRSMRSSHLWSSWTF